MVGELDQLGSVLSLRVHSVEEKSSKISNITMEQRLPSKVPQWGDMLLKKKKKSAFVESYWPENPRKPFISVLQNKRVRRCFPSLSFLTVFVCHPSQEYENILLFPWILLEFGGNFIDYSLKIFCPKLFLRNSVLLNFHSWSQCHSTKDMLIKLSASLVVIFTPGWIGKNASPNLWSQICPWLTM